MIPERTKLAFYCRAMNHRYIITQIISENTAGFYGLVIVLFDTKTDKDIQYKIILNAGIYLNEAIKKIKDEIEQLELFDRHGHENLALIMTTTGTKFIVKQADES